MHEFEQQVHSQWWSKYALNSLICWSTLMNLWGIRIYIHWKILSFMFGWSQLLKQNFWNLTVTPATHLFCLCISFGAVTALLCHNIEYWDTTNTASCKRALNTTVASTWFLFHQFLLLKDITTTERTYFQHMGPSHSWYHGDTALPNQQLHILSVHFISHFNSYFGLQQEGSRRSDLIPITWASCIILVWYLWVW